MHRLDPRVKIAVAVALAVVISPGASHGAPLIALPMGLILVAWAGLPLKPLVRRLVGINFFVAFLWLFLPFSTPGNVVFSLGPLAATDTGLSLALLITLKTNAVMLWFLALVATSDVASLGQAIGRMGLSPKLVFMFLFTYRFIHVLGDELSRLRIAARLRGFVPRNSTHTYRTLASLMAMVLLGAMRRAEMSRRAMVLRGFQGKFTSLRRFEFGPQAAIFLVIAGVFMAGLAVLELMHV